MACSLSNILKLYPQKACYSRNCLVARINNVKISFEQFSYIKVRYLCINHYIYVCILCESVN